MIKELLLITADRVLVGEKLEEKKDWSILVADGVIEKVGPNKELKKLSPTKEVIMEGCTITPGLFDCHNHLTLDTSLKDYYTSLVCLSEGEISIRASLLPKRDLMSGVTTARCVCDKYALDVLCKNLIEQGTIAGPDYKVGGYGLRTTQGHGLLGYACDGVDNIRKAIRENLLRGVDWIKLYTTGGSLKRLTGNRLPSYYSKEEIFAAIDEAHRFGTPITSHCLGGVAMDQLIEGGVDSLEHCFFMTPKQCEAAKAKNVTLSLTVAEYFEDFPMRPVEFSEKFRTYQQEVQKCMEYIMKSGANYVFGTDGVHGGLYKEANLAVRFGATTQEALCALTINAARLLAVDDIKGSIDEGKQADLVVVEGNPIENIMAIKEVKAVYKKGNKVE